MSPTTIGWVLDKDTSRRRLHLFRLAAGVVGVVTEIDGQTLGVVQLDEEGVLALVQVVVQAFGHTQRGHPVAK